MRRFFIPAARIDGSRVTVDGSDYHHLIHVLRKQPGDIFEATDGWGNILRIRITDAAGGHAAGEIIGLISAPERSVTLTLYQAIPRQGLFDFIIEKSAELGVRRVVPVVTERTVVRLAEERSAKKLERWRRIANETVKKIGRADTIDVLPVCGLNEIIGQLHPGSLRIAAWEMEETRGLRTILREKPDSKDVEIVIGPEGGLSAGEISALTGMGFESVSLGKRILKVETAAVAAIANIFYELESD
ncbi:MAG: 16S rRNA (uracil(1498)-N(3))-methyltransferase [Brevinematales bacterium]|nr:16S rRNA (uracil(1498)-N(3))-methyltransferase [Brevinematales bacterium]